MSAKGDDEHAMADYNSVLQKRPKAVHAIYLRGTLYMRKSALQSALDDFNAALNIKPDLYRALADRGHLLTVTKDFDGALADFAEAERINPAAPMALNLSLSRPIPRWASSTRRSPTATA